MNEPTLPTLPVFSLLAHVCAGCGEGLHKHYSTGATCPTGGGSFNPDKTTRALFPDQYPAPEEGN